MKIKLDIDCTPEEVRQFFGLPEVKPLPLADTPARPVNDHAVALGS